MAIAETQQRFVLDTTSLVCPYPYLEARKALEELPPGGELELITDNEATVRSSVPALAERFHTSTEVLEEPGRWRVVFRKA